MMKTKQQTQEATLTVDPLALRHNLQQIKQQAPQSRVWAVLKSNAYGHGLIETAQILDQADGFALARFYEAQQLREQNIDKPLLLLEGILDANELHYASEQAIDIVVHSWEQLSLLKKTPLKNPIQVWLKVDTGMGRLGFWPADATQAFHQLCQLSTLKKPVHIMTHFSCADAPENPQTQLQIDTLMKILPQDIGDVSMANSAGIFAWPQSHQNWVRPGLCLYGVSPFPNRIAKDLHLLPAMHAQAPIIAIRHFKTGQAVGYESIWKAPYDTYIGVIALGYGDGYPRDAPEGTPVLINGRRVPLVGKVSMDMMTINLGPNPKDCVGDMVTLWGEQLPIEEVAQALGTIPYELLTQVGARYHRQLKEININVLTQKHVIS